MYRISLLLGAMLSVCTSSFALPEEGDDFQDQCTQEQVTILYYQGTAYCTASVNGINYPLSLFVEKTTESSVILNGGNGASCRAQVPFYTSEASVRNVCKRVPAQPFYRMEHTYLGCISQRATGKLNWSRYQNKLYFVERSVNGGAFQPVGTFTADSPVLQYSISPPGGRFVYRLQAQETTNGVYGSWSYVTLNVPNCQGMKDW
ncbi:hypothetical protein [Roseateles puraquae]|jgi:hypothetical protein|uniref:Uncharacterized protein n=1 Tax=Roseateles puraquae TaxID=431059 RepID=A0A254N6B1_9BURK|nr:hypothetical protein [Roseateles puraquae]MDG0854317.1 hypothetical protein [Roseateles puraquae]OWR03569.1 hypothetical protein CDO81_13830 [Roseateles puraquae]